MKPELLRPQHEKITRIFLSATAQDCRTYRSELKDAVGHRIPGTTVHLQEHWVGPWNDVVDCCLKELHDSHGYFGLFGYRYGWLPDGRDCSITELEFRAACDKWIAPVPGPSSDPPIFVFLPDERSEAASELRKLANQVLDKEFGEDERKKRDSRQNQDDFRKRVCSGRKVNLFKDRQDLREQAITSIQNYNTAILEIAFHAAIDQYAARQARLTRIPDEELGAIGRNRQLSALDGMLGKMRMALDAPAMCVLVHGSENCGYRQFIAFLKTTEVWELENSDPFPIKPADMTNLSAIIASMAQHLGKVSEPQSIASLGEAIIRRCERDNVVFIIEDIGSQTDRLAAFQTGLWAPLEQELRKRWLKAHKGKGRCTIVVVDRALTPEGEFTKYVTSAGTDNDDDSVDNFNLLLALPPLTYLSESDVADWLKSLAVRGLKDLKQQVERLRIAQRVTRARDGSPDGSPLNVYDRLEGEGFWRSGR
jgi:hypothetical protein